MKKQSLPELFLNAGKEFERKHLFAFLQRKPKKVLVHTIQTLRFYRAQSDIDLFEALAGTILAWRYLMHNERIPLRQKNRLERAILRSFNFILNKTKRDCVEEVEFLLQETLPARSVLGPGNPLRELICLKLLEFEINISKHPRNEIDELASKWRHQYSNLTKKFRLRIPFSSVLS